MRTSYDEADVRRLIEQLASHVAAEFKPGQTLNIIGIRTRGETLAQREANETEAVVKRQLSAVIHTLAPSAGAMVVAQQQWDRRRSRELCG